MGKIGQVFIVMFVVGMAYLLLMVVRPVLTETASTANTTMHATSNMSLYPGTAETVIAMPWILWFVPAVIGIAVIVMILKKS